MKSKLQGKQMAKKSLDNLILSVKSDIDKVDKLNDSEKRLLLLDIEIHIRLIGEQVERIALEQMGITSQLIKDIYWEYVCNQEIHYNYILLKEKIINLVEEIEDKIVKFKDKQNKNEEYTKLKANLKMANHALNEIEVMTNGKSNNSSYLLNNFVFRFFKEMTPAIPASEVSSILARNYIMTLSKIRPMGGNLEIKSYHSGRKEKVFKRFIESELEAIKKIQESLLFPNKWINNSNKSFPLFIQQAIESKHLTPPGDNADASYGHIHSPNKIVSQKYSVLDIYDLSPTKNLLVHELGHRFIHLFPIIGELEEILYLRRTTDDKGLRTENIQNTDYRVSDFVDGHAAMDPYLHRERIRKAWCKSKSKKSRVKKEKISDKEWSLSEIKTGYEVFATGLPSILNGRLGCLAGLENREDKDDELRHFTLGILATI